MWWVLVRHGTSRNATDRRGGRDFVTSGDIAKRLGISHYVTVKLVQQDGFPEPVVTVGHNRVWSLRQVEAFLAAQPLPPVQCTDREAPRAGALSKTLALSRGATYPSRTEILLVPLRRNGGRAGGHAYRRAMGRGRRPEIMRGAAGSRDVPGVSSPDSVKLAAPMVALSDAAAITDDQAIAARFFVASSSVTADHNGGRIRVLGRRDAGWRFGDLIGGSNVKAPLFGSDLRSVVRVVLAGHEVAQSEEGFALETSDGGLVLRQLDGSPVACLRQGRWERDSLRGLELTIEAA
jgi:hypothetical protein